MQNQPCLAYRGAEVPREPRGRDYDDRTPRDKPECGTTTLFSFHTNRVLLSYPVSQPYLLL